MHFLLGLGFSSRRDFLAGAAASTIVSPMKEDAPLRQNAINPTGSSYSQAMEVRNASRWAFVSGQVPADENGAVPEAFHDQARLVWRNIDKQLRDAEMTLANIVKITTFLSDRQYRQANYEVRHAVLGDHSPAMTIIIADIYDLAWLLEIEVVAAA